MDTLTLVGIALLVAGFVLVGIEMILPGFGVPGVSGIVCLVAGVFLLADTVVEGVFITIAVLAILGILMAVILWLLSRGKLRAPITLEDEQKRTEGYLSSNDLQYLLARNGTAVTDLRPVGTGLFDGVKLDVISEGNYILKDAEIQIIRVEGSKLVVRERTAADQA